MARSQATAPCSGSAPKHSASPGTSVTVPEQGTGWPASACPAGRGKAPRGGKARPLAPALPPHGLEGRPCQGHPASGLRAFLAQRPQRTPPFTSERLLRVRTCVGVRGSLGSRQAPRRGLASSGELPRAREGGPALREDSRWCRTHQDKARAVPRADGLLRPRRADTHQHGPGKIRSWGATGGTPPSERLDLTCHPQQHEGQRVGATGSPALGDPPGSAGWRAPT